MAVPPHLLQSGAVGRQACLVLGGCTLCTVHLGFPLSSLSLGDRELGPTGKMQRVLHHWALLMPIHELVVLFSSQHPPIQSKGSQKKIPDKCVALLEGGLQLL